MSRYVLPLLVALSCFVPASAFAGSIGVFTGLSRMGFTGDAPSDTKYQSNFGPIVGAHAEFSLGGGVGLAFEPMYVQRGTGIAFAVEGEDESIDSLDVALDYLAVPVLRNFRTGGARTVVTGGLDVA